MRNVAPSRALVRRSRRLLEVAFIVVAVGIFLAIVGLALYAVPFMAARGTVFQLFDLGRGVLFVGGVVLGLTGLGLAVRAVTWKVENDLAKVTGEVLSPNLDERFIFIRNISKRSLGYIDAVLIGPPGLLVFRIVDYRGSFLNEAGKWLRRDKRGGWAPLLANPTQDTIDDMKSLQRFLNDNGFDENLPIYGVVVFIDDDPAVKLTLKDPVLPATHLSSLHTRLQRNYLAKDRIDQDTVMTIFRLLCKDC
jgi:hypothetical protein